MAKVIQQKKVYKGKMYRAFEAVTEQPVPAIWFAKQHNVSLHVLRQANRLNQTAGKQVYVRLRNGELMIYRE